MVYVGCNKANQGLVARAAANGCARKRVRAAEGCRLPGPPAYLECEQMTSPLRKRAENAPSSDQRLLDCLCSAPDPASKAQLAEFAASDWNRVVASATKHGVRPLLYERLASVASVAKVPDTMLALLRESFLVNGLRNVLLYQDLGDVLEGFQQESIPVIVLKGAHLAHLVYETIASRQMADIDLLVKPSDLPKAAARLIKLGYACEIGV